MAEDFFTALRDPDHEVRDLLGPGVVGLVKIRDQGQPLQHTFLIGSGTFVRFGSLYGILTAAHVADELQLPVTIGLLLFSRRDGSWQFKLDLERSDVVFAPGWKRDNAPDLAFIHIADPSRIGDLQAWGCVFYDLEQDRLEALMHRPHTVSLAVNGVLGVSRNAGLGDRGEPVTGFTLLFGHAVDAALSDDQSIITLSLQYDDGVAPPGSYGGVSGGPLWILTHQPGRPLRRILAGVAYFQGVPDADGNRDLHCQSLSMVGRVLMPEMEKLHALG